MKKPSKGKHRRAKSREPPPPSSPSPTFPGSEASPASSTANQTHALDERIAILSKALEDMLADAKQADIPTPKALAPRIRDLIDECKKHLSETGKSECICIAVAGKFSCGKSQFINSLTGCDLAPVDAMRTTCCKTTFTGDPEGTRIRVVEAETGKVISKKEYRHRAAKRSASANDFVVYLPGRDWKDMALVDTPGFDPPPEGENEASGETTDAQISKKAVQEADVVFFLLDMTSGTLTEDSKDYLLELKKAKNNSPLHLYLVLNKADLIPPKARENILRGVIATCEENGIGYEGAMPYCSLTEKCKELRHWPETARQSTLALAAELREKVKDGMMALRRRKKQILGGRRTGVQNALLKRLEDAATNASEQFDTFIRQKEKEAASDDTVDLDELVDEAVDTLKLKAFEWFLDNPPSFKFAKLAHTGWFSKDHVVCLSKSAGVRWEDLSSTEEALRQVLDEVHPAFDGCEESLARLLVTISEDVLQSMKADKTDTSIDIDNKYCIRCKYRQIPDARTRLLEMIQVDFPDLFEVKCRSGAEKIIHDAWETHLKAKLREFRRKKQPLEKDIETIGELLNHPPKKDMTWH